MLFKGLLFVCAVTCAYGQAEQAIFAQLYYPVQRAKPAPPTTATATVSAIPQPEEQLKVLPRSRRNVIQQLYRPRRTAFDEDLESNEAMFRRLRELMKDPEWVPEIRPRDNFIY